MNERSSAQRAPLLVVTWFWVGLPFAYGFAELVYKVTQLFGG